MIDKFWKRNPPKEGRQAAKEQTTRSDKTGTTPKAPDHAASSAPEWPYGADHPRARATRPTSSATAPSELDALADSLKEVQKEGGFYFTPSQEAVDSQHLVRKVDSVELSRGAGDAVVLKLTGGDQTAVSAGITEGYSIRVPDAFERDASEHSVRIRVLARSQDFATTRLAIAYSTNEMGNSGWQWQDLGPSWTVCELVWNVPKMKDGNGDFIGLLPDGPGAPGVEIHSVAATIS